MRAMLVVGRKILVCLNLLLFAGQGIIASAQQARPAAVPPAVPSAQSSPTASSTELIAVLDVEGVDTSKSQSSAITDRLREELLRSGKFTLVNREQIDAVLNEQALQQTGCTSQECAVQVGKVLGVRKIVAAKVTRLDDQHWLLSATLTDVETAQTIRAESVKFEGSFFNLLDNAIVNLAAKLATSQPSLEKIAAASPPKPQPAPEAPKGEEKKSSSLWWWILGGVAAVAIAAAAGGGGGGGGGSKSSSSGSSSTQTVHVSW